MAPPSLLECYEDAALQWHFMRPLDIEAADERVYFAVDANVVHAFLQPHGAAVASTRNLIGLGQIFRFDEPPAIKTLAYSIISRVFLSLSSQPLVCLPPIEREIQELIARHVGDRIELFDSITESAEALYLQLISQAPELQSLITCQAIEGEMVREIQAGDKRLRRALSPDRLILAQRVTATTHTASLVEALRPPSDMIEQLEWSEKRHAWEKRLHAVGRKESESSLRDTSALSTLQMANERLSRENRGERLCYLTTDSSIFSASQTFLWKHNGKMTTFHDHFIRHPRAYLDRLGVVLHSPADRESQLSSVADWLTVLLGRFSEELKKCNLFRGKIVFAKGITESIGRLEEEQPTLADEIMKKWAEFAIGPIPGGSSRLLHLESAASGEATRGDLEKLAEELRNAVAVEHDRWIALLDASVAARFALEVETPGAAPSHEAVALIFHERPKFHQFLRQAEAWLQKPADYNHTAYREWRAEVRTEEPTGYDDLLGHGFLFCLHGHWRTAEILAKNARSLTTPNSEAGRTSNNGREAAYLEACARRINAKTRKDLGGVEDLLEEALRIGRDERIADRSAELSPDQECQDPILGRFRVEIHMTQLTYHLFNWSENPDAPHPSEILAIRELEGELSRCAFALCPVHPHSTQLSREEATALAATAERCARAALSLRLQFGDFSKENWIRMPWSHGGLDGEDDGLLALFNRLFEDPRLRAEMSGLVHALCRLINTTPTRSRTQARQTIDRLSRCKLHYDFDRLRRDQMIRNVRRYLDL